MKKTELLAPAKDKETAIAAIDCGADAVYMGAYAFGARHNATNSLDDIKDVVDYAHKFWAKVFITINTILTDDELKDAIALVKKLDNIGVDAIIIQDLGLLKCLMEENLTIPIHMSTQCDNRDIAKVSFFNKLGVSRVVLARELSLNNIAEIHNENPNLELEAFVHGALCVSYSGQCYLSQYIGGRSANRGECAQPCRKKYTVKNCSGKILAKDIYALCLKDFNASSCIEKMINTGVFSFKIEGRLKEKNYVKNITAYYRQQLDKFSKKISSGKSAYQFTPNPEKSFNRGFTTYFLNNRENCYNFNSPKSQGEYLGKVIEVKEDYFVIKTKKNINSQDGLVFGSNGFLVNKVVKNKIYPNKKIKLTVGTDIYRNVDVEFEKLLSYPVKRQIEVSIKVEANVITAIDENNVSSFVTIESTEIANNQEKMQENFVKQFSKTGESDFYTNKIEILTELPFIPISEINRLRRELFMQLMNERLKQYKRDVQQKLSFTPYYKDEIDYRGNIHNTKAKNFYSDCNCIITEFSAEKELPPRQIELMRTKHCLKYALNMCKSKENLVLEDEYGQIYPLKFDCKHCEMVVLSPDKN